MKSLYLYIFLVLLLSCKEEILLETPRAANPFFEKAFEHLDGSRPDSAFFYFLNAKDLFEEQKDSLNVAICLINMAIILTNKSDYYGGQETSLQAIYYLNPDSAYHHHYLGTNYNNLGIASYQLKDYTKALEFYDLAIKFSDDSLNTRIYLNNKAKVFHDDGKYDAALAIYNRLINETNKNRREYARVLTNIALSRSKQDTSYVAAPDLLTALRIRKEERDLWGQNSSYAHLSDYYKKSNSPDSALFYAMSMYDIAQQINSANDQISALQRLIRLAPVSRTKRYFEIYQPLRDSVELARNTAKNQFAVIRYEVEKSKAENLRLQRDNAEKAFQIDRQRTYTTIAVLFTLAVIAAAMYVYRKRQQRLQLEAENKIKAYQLNTSKKIHDVVANGLYRVMAEIEHQNDIDRDNILDRLESMYEKSRDISYETDAPPVKESDFKQKIASLLTSFATETTKVIISGNNAEFWSHVSSQARHELEHVLQELMVNMRKHSQATNVVVRFEQTGHQISIHYQDNGIGMPSAIFYGNGLSNTGNRIKSIGGLLTFDTEVKQGVRIHIALPVS